MALDVFISYAIADKVTADAACAALEAEGIRCWIAPRDVLPGMDYAEAIIEAIEKARGMLLIFSSNANRSNQVKREVERAVHHGIPIIPFRIEDVPPNRALEYFISAPHWLDALTPPLEQHLKHLASTIRMLLSRSEVGSEPPIAQSRLVPGQVAEFRGGTGPGSSSMTVGAIGASANQPGARAGSTNLPAPGYQYSSNVQPDSKSGSAGAHTATIPGKSNAPLMILILVGAVAVIVAGMVGIGVAAFYLIQRAAPRPYPYVNATPTASPRVVVPSTPSVVQATPTPGTTPSNNYSDVKTALTWRLAWMQKTQKR
jgi:flagellar basal body-associated protein FliL